jgi:hypothetical protein
MIAFLKTALVVGTITFAFARAVRRRRSFDLKNSPQA